MKMKLRAAGGENHRCDLNSVNGSDRESGTGAAKLDKEAVFEWFGLQLNPAGRVELLCGLLHMCQPLELRFLGACLEDLARRDFTVLRDFEIRANSPADLEGLVDVSDPVVLSKLLVYLSLLGSKSRECACILFRTLSRMDVGMYGALPETVDQLRLLFTMGSLHPAFSFYQREELRAQLDRLQRWVCSNIYLKITAITLMCKNGNSMVWTSTLNTMLTFIVMISDGTNRVFTWYKQGIYMELPENFTKLLLYHVHKHNGMVLFHVLVKVTIKHIYM